MQKNISILLLIIHLLLITTGCNSVEYTNRKQLMLTPESLEISKSNELWKKINKKNSKANITDPKFIAVKRVGKNISTVTNHDYKWEFVLFKVDEPNAFCLPGGKVAVNTGIFNFIDNDAELATIISHEIAHAIARHAGERNSYDILKNLGSTIIGFVFDGLVGNLSSNAFGLGAEYGAILPYERLHEYEADQIGLILMSKAGYDPKYAITFWNKFSQIDNTNNFAEFFSTHPMSKKRLIELKEMLPEANKVYNSAIHKHGAGEIIK